MAGVEVNHREGASPEEEVMPSRRAVHRPVEGLTMQELLRTVTKTSGNSAWAETIQPLSTFENNIASRISSQTAEAREGIFSTYAEVLLQHPFDQRNALLGHGKIGLSCQEHLFHVICVGSKNLLKF